MFSRLAHLPHLLTYVMTFKQISFSSTFMRLFIERNNDIQRRASATQIFQMASLDAVCFQTGQTFLSVSFCSVLSEREGRQQNTTSIFPPAGHTIYFDHHFAIDIS
jgi:hypothetical protein